ncbi:hypothetical protein PS467_09370 [Streptomyces luomodiensis]|uniref:Uncharacterized protein n=1 Tax=Streptomyces luomodiensis TaxID=3026192 RepID=A0ABY9USS9_9ACTN|nr:hypothetical protein [Streptomyces sp. SCA4-21]WNE95536.1 hypothetical protein PS467_09370 [Streptomyces sp. SCA4-21]
MNRTFHFFAGFQPVQQQRLAAAALPPLPLCRRRAAWGSVVYPYPYDALRRTPAIFH